MNIQKQGPLAKYIEPNHNMGRKDLSPTTILKELIGNTTVQFGKGQNQSGKKQRKAFDLWQVIQGEMFNLSGNINESKGSGITITLFHKSSNPISFEGVPIVLEPNVRYGEERIDRSNLPQEVEFKSTRTSGEFKATFDRLYHESYKLKVGDPDFTIFGYSR